MHSSNGHTSQLARLKLSAFSFHIFSHCHQRIKCKKKPNEKYGIHSRPYRFIFPNPKIYRKDFNTKLANFKQPISTFEGETEGEKTKSSHAKEQPWQKNTINLGKNQ